LLAAFGAGKQAETFFAKDLSAEDSRKLRDFIVWTKGHEVHDRSPTDSELNGIAETYLDSLFRLFRRLAAETDQGLLITKASWDQANKSLLPGSLFHRHRPHHKRGSFSPTPFTILTATSLAEEAAIASMVFRGGDMDHDGRLSFTEFAIVAVLLSAARPGPPHSHPLLPSLSLPPCVSQPAPRWGGRARMERRRDWEAEMLRQGETEASMRAHALSHAPCARATRADREAGCV
jgi:hypothetical protein